LVRHVLFGSKKHVLVPCYRVRINGKEYLVDAYFMDKTLIPPRRTLLIYPVGGEASEKGSIKPAYEGREAIRLLLDAYKWCVDKKKLIAVRAVKRISVQLFWPAGRLKDTVYYDVDEKEINGALYIILNTFGKKPLKTDVEILGKVYVPVTARIRSGEIKGFMSKNTLIHKNYTYLYRIDEVFQDNADKLFLGKNSAENSGEQ